MSESLGKIRAVADYQFGKGVGVELFPENVDIAYSRRTGRIRYVYLEGRRLATLRPKDGLFSLSILGAERIVKNVPGVGYIVTIQDEVSDFISSGGDAFAKHVVKAGDEIRPRDEVVVVDSRKRVLAVGRALLSGEEMEVFRRGVAVRVRRGGLRES